MATDIPSALIGAGATVVAAALPLAWKAIADRWGPRPKRRGELLGRWIGSGEDQYVEDAREVRRVFSIAMTFTSVGRVVKADAVIRGRPDENDELSLFGTFYSEEYLQLAYCDRRFVRKQLGVVVLGLGEEGYALRGYYAGFSPRRKTIVAGTIALKKTP